MVYSKQSSGLNLCRLLIEQAILHRTHTQTLA